MNNSNHIYIFDTTLRDGEQSPGASMNLEEKIRIAQALDEMGVDIIEAGFPIASVGDFQSVNEIAKTVENSTVCGLSRASKGDIERCAEAIKPAKKGRIHTFLSTSPLHMKYKLQKSPDEVAQMIADSVKYARNFCDDVEWSAEDGSRTELDFLCRCVEIAIKAGAKTINIPDTVGYAMPTEYTKMIETLFNKVPNIDKAIISTHCHNDLGLGVANSLAAVQAGARQVECTINGLGERAGNAALEEVIMALRTRGDIMPYKNNIKTEKITNVSRLVSSITGFVIQPNKAVVGANAFAHESGIHQDGVLKHAATYEIMTPESVGLLKSELVLGKHSGRHAFKVKLEELGYDLGENSFEDAFFRFKELADAKKQVFDEDIRTLIDDTVYRSNDRIKFESLVITTGSKVEPKSELVLFIDGEKKTATTTGDGPIDAIFNGVKSLFPHGATLKLYQVHAVTEGTDAQAKVTVRLEENGKTVNGQGADTDTLVASVKAYVNSLNKLVQKREKTAPKPINS